MSASSEEEEEEGRDRRKASRKASYVSYVLVPNNSWKASNRWWEGASLKAIGGSGGIRVGDWAGGGGRRGGSRSEGVRVEEGIGK
eukprot:CAMPEP_0184668316 /NCGR_PEP_ID=MMETSP0308-20130426/71862_1 /TAXON_ID=38269 /ORGANISM="Gloeochaete witrockiana, Strain SAG 46.84" /LENGTH=84 /DNA_ID=CAMNT_0027113973 /DNA_START=399 /DNA_END=653 /DNA_ORIENTATION=-